MGSNHSHLKASLIDDADDNIIYRINGAIDLVAIDQVMSWCLRSGLIAHEGKFKALILRTHPYDGTLKPFMLGDKIMQYKSFLVCLQVTIDKKKTLRGQGCTNSCYIIYCLKTFNVKKKII